MSLGRLGVRGVNAPNEISCCEQNRETKYRAAKQQEILKRPSLFIQGLHQLRHSSLELLHCRIATGSLARRCAPILSGGFARRHFRLLLASIHPETSQV